MKKVVGEAQSFIDFFKKEEPELNPPYAKTHPELLRMLDFYKVSKYTENNWDQGERRLFMNVINSPVLVASKMIDIDLKDIIATPGVGSNEYEAWIYQTLLRLFLKQNQFGEVINKIVFNGPRYGTVFLKKTKDGIQNVPARNIACNPLVWDFSPPLIEKHVYSLQSFKITGDAKGWDNVDKVYEKFKDARERDVVVYEIYGELGDTRDNFFLIAGTKKGEFPFRGRYPLYTTRIDLEKDFPYKAWHWSRLHGRFLGWGQGERFLENQIAKNYNEYLLRNGLKWTSLQLFQTTDENVARNLLHDAENGDVFKVNAGIERIAMEERNLSAFSYYDQKWDANTRKNGFNYEIMSGGRPPAGTPLGTSVLQTKMAQGFFGLKQEGLGQFIKEVINDWVLGDFKSRHKKNYKLLLKELPPEKIDILKRSAEKKELKNEYFNYLMRERSIPSPRERQIFSKMVKERMDSERALELPKDFIKNLDVKLDVTVTEEEIDRAGKFSMMQMMMQLLGSNPQVFENPRTRQIIYNMAEQAGFNPVELEMEEPAPAPQGIESLGALEKGGSISPGTRQTTPTQTRATREV